MKKTIAIALAILALAALTVTAFAAGEAAPAAGPEETAAIEAKLTEADALAAALKDAGEKEADVTVTKNKLSEKETVDGETVAVYTVRFTTDTTTYKYILDANTGAVLYKSIVFESPDVVFKSREGGEDGGRGEASGEPSGEMNENGRGGRASSEPDGTDSASGETGRGSGRSGGRRGASAEPAAEAVQPDAVTA